MKLAWALVIMWLPSCWILTACQLSFKKNTLTDRFQAASQVTETVLKATMPQEHSVIFIIDGDLAVSESLVKEITNSLVAVWGTGIFKINLSHETNSTSLKTMTKVLQSTRKLRILSRHAVVVVLSERPDFLSIFGEATKKSRLLAGYTRMIAITKLPLQNLRAMMQQQWTYAMMATMVLNLEDNPNETRYGIYVNLPYTEFGGKVVRLASWSRDKGLTFYTSNRFFPPKFNNFYRAQVNVTALPFPPYWNVIEEDFPNGTTQKKYTGTDFLMIESIAKALNFTLYVLPTANWDEVTKRVEERISFVASIIYAVFPKRLEKYDYSYMFEYAFHAFTMAKPAIKPQWQSLYYPMTDTVWLCILLVVFAMPLPFIAITNKITTPHDKTDPGINSGFLLHNIVGTLFGQGTSGKLPSKHSYRLLFASWLVFAFIVGTAYRGNLTASLTAPKYPTRVETLEQLVSFGARVTMPPYGAHFRDYFKGSDSTIFKTLGDRVDIVKTALAGVQESTVKKQAHMEARRYLELIIAEKFTKADGSTGLYIGQESVFPGLSAWPIPHDAPFKEALDRAIMAIIEGGLYEKWSEDLVNEARRESSKRKQEILKQREAEGLVPESDPSGEDGSTALTIIHMQGPLLLLVLGLGIAGVIFVLELVMMRCC